ncbi:MAG TPA: hypothetical protein PKW35_18315 [Nannocystaceae bacterium]|nr:hypothetical protein [Nannocystaceae bacterium]
MALRGDDPDRAGRLPGWTGKKAVKSGAPQPVQKSRRKKEVAVPKGPLEAMALNQRQGDLARLYSQIAQEGVEIEGGVESMAMAPPSARRRGPRGRIVAAAPAIRGPSPTLPRARLRPRSTAPAHSDTVVTWP